MFGMLVLGHGPMETGSAQDDRISPSLRLRWRVKCGKVGRQELNQDRNQMNKLRFSLAGALSVAALLACFSLFAAPTIYEWIDDDGVVHYSEDPPADVDYQRVSTSVPATSGSDDSDTDPDSDEDEPDAQTDQPEAQEGPDPEVVAERCEQARSHLTLLQETTRLMTNDRGSARRLTRETRQQRIEHPHEI